MKTIKITGIVKTKNRQRKTFDQDALEVLQQGILSKGLLHPIVLAPMRKGSNEPPYVLVAGGRRLLALTELHKVEAKIKHDGEIIPKDEIPYILITDQDEIGRRETELEENILREDLTWPDRVRAEDELHKLRKEKNPGQTYTQTAEEIVKAEGKGKSVGKKAQEVSRATFIAQHLDDPEVSKARNPKEAFSIASRKQQLFFEEALEKKQPTDTVHKFYKTNMEIFFADLDKKTRYDCIIADPPYGINSKYFGNAAKVGHGYDDDEEYAWMMNYLILDAGFDFIKENGMLYIFCDMDLFVNIRESAENMGWNCRRVPLVWHKGNKGHLDTGSVLGYRRSYELIFCAWKGKAPFKYLYPDVINTCPPDLEKVHAAQKPVSLYKKLLTHVCDAGANILDPCCGSGNVFKAATELRLKATGVEPDEKFWSECEHNRRFKDELGLGF